MKEKQNNKTGLSSLLTPVRVKLETTYIYTQILVAGVTGHLFAALKVLLSDYCSKYKRGMVSTAACLTPTPGSVIPSVRAIGNRYSPYQHIIPCLTPAATNKEFSSFISIELDGTFTNSCINNKSKQFQHSGVGIKEKQNNTTGLSSLLAHLRAKLKTTYIYIQILVAGVTGPVFAALKVLLSDYCSKYKGGMVSTAACFTPTPGLVIPFMQADGTFCFPYQNLIPCLTPATTNKEFLSLISVELDGTFKQI